MNVLDVCFACVCVLGMWYVCVHVCVYRHMCVRGICDRSRPM